MDRLEAFETMLADLQKQADSEKEQMEKLKAAGREKSATYRQYLGNRMIYSQMLGPVPEIRADLILSKKGASP